jgi:hypothetical protein
MSRKDSEVLIRLDGREKPLKQAVVKSLHRIIASSLDFLGGTLKPLLSHPGKETFIAVQDRDPYLERLLLALHGRK